MFRSPLFLAASATCSMAIAVGQTAHFSEDFELDPVGPLSGGWTTDHPGFVVVDVPTEPSFGGRAIRITGSVGPSLNNSYALSPSFTPSEGGRVGFDLLIESGNGQYDVEVLDGSGGSSSILRFLPSGEIGVYRSVGFGSFNFSLTSGTWVAGVPTRFEIDYRGGALLQDGVRIASTFNLQTSSGIAVGPARIGITDSGGGAGPASVWFDNFRVEVCPEPVSSCPGAPNSHSPTGAVMFFNGSNFLGTNDVGFYVFDLPPHALMLLFHADGTTNMPLGDGTLCLGPGPRGLFRGAFGMSFGISPPFTATARGPIELDLQAAPYNAGPSAILSGLTWNFQAAYRDSPAFGAGFNFTNVLTVTFCQ